MLTKKDIYNLRKQVIINSVFIKDYENNLFIEPKNVCAFFDGAIDYYKDDINDIKNITLKMFYNYYLCYESDPLLQNNYIASKTIYVFYALLILDINDDSVIVNKYFMDAYNEKTTRPKKYKLYYNAAGDAYFILDNRREYINTFVRRDYGI